jgi:hypothetical protein
MQDQKGAVAAVLCPMRVARTIADLAPKYLAKAVQDRTLDRNLWA